MRREIRGRYRGIFGVVGFAVAVSAPLPVAADDPFVRGDINVDGRISIADVLWLQRVLFVEPRVPPCVDALDVDDNGHIDLTDAFRILRFVLFAESGEAPPSPPYPEPGPDPTEDPSGPASPIRELDCKSYSVVEGEETEDLIRLGDFEGEPGDPVEIPVYVTSAVETEGVQLVVSYDPGVLVFPDERPELAFEGTFYEGLVDPSLTIAEVEAFPEEGVFLVVFIANIIHIGFELPAGEETLAFETARPSPETLLPAGSSSSRPTSTATGTVL